VLKKEENINRT